MKITRKLFLILFGIVTVAALAILCACNLFSKNHGSDNSDGTGSGSTCVHHWLVDEIIKKPTCTERGLNVYRCSKCDEKEEREIPAQHDMMKNNRIANACSRCDYTTGIIYKLSEDGKYYTVTGHRDTYYSYIRIPSTYKDLPVLGIEDEAFKENLPYSSVYDMYCEIEIDDGVEFIGNSAFADNRNTLARGIIPASVKEIGDEAFYGDLRMALNLKENSKLISIGESAFEKSSSLASLEQLPASVEKVGAKAFYGCKGAFDGCNKLKEVHISDIESWCAVKFASAADNPAYKASNLYLNDQPLTDLVIPEGVESISAYAFAGVRNIHSVTFPDSLTTVYTNAFYFCNGLTAVYADDFIKWCAIRFYDIYSNPLTSGKALYIGGERVTEIDFPDDA